MLKMNPVFLLGAVAGARTATPVLNELEEEADSNIPALAYTVPYVVGNVILPIWEL
jgi:putative transport protein